MSCWLPSASAFSYWFVSHYTSCSLVPICTILWGECLESFSPQVPSPCQTEFGALGQEPRRPESSYLASFLNLSVTPAPPHSLPTSPLSTGLSAWLPAQPSSLFFLTGQPPQTSFALSLSSWPADLLLSQGSLAALCPLPWCPPPCSDPGLLEGHRTAVCLREGKGTVYLHPPSHPCV